MQLVVLGLNFKTVPLEVREKFSISEESARSGLAHLSEQDEIEEAVILSTCNRTEIYAVLHDGEGRKDLVRFFCTLSGTTEEEAKKEYFFYYEGNDCIRHLFNVVSGLDSMVIGESGILNQVKTAYTLSLAEKGTRTILNTLFHRAITTGKRVRTETHIAYSAVSVSFAAIKQAEKVLGSLEDRSILIFGAGEAGALVARNCEGRGLRQILIANRHGDKAEELAREVGGKAVPFESALDQARDVDIIVSATGASQYIIKAWDIRKLMMERHNKPLVCIDIAVPSDIEPEVGSVRNVTLYNIDDLKEIVRENIRFRKKEAERAKKIIDEEIQSIDERFTYLSTRPVMVSLSDKAEKIRQRELHRAFSKAPGLNDEERKIIDNMTHMIVRKILREPMIRLNTLSGTRWENESKRAATNLFHLEVGRGQKLEK